MREKAIAEYHRSLATDETLDPEFFSHLKVRMKANLLSYGGRALGVALRPHLLTREQYDRLAQASEILAGAFDKLATAMLADPLLLNQVGLLEREQSLAVIDPGFSFPAVTTRLDAFVWGDEVKFVEYNAENPSSLTDQEGINQVLFEVCALQSLAERYRLYQFAPADALLRSLQDTYQEWGGHGAPNIAILDWADLPTANEFVLLRNHFVAHSVPTIICTPDELEYSNGTLRRDDFHIDLVYKRIIIHEYLERYDESHPLVRAYANGDVCLVNPFRCKIVHKKACFEFLTDETREGWFTPVEREVISRCVPWTRRVSERRTFRNGQAIDLVEHIRTNRTDFILKPNDDYGGIGVFLGHQSTEAEWDEMLFTALKSDYVVQEIVELHTEEFPIFNEKGWGLEPVFVDTNPFIFRGRAHGAMVRLSDSPIVNVTSGGGETGFFVIEGIVDP